MHSTPVRTFLPKLRSRFLSTLPDQLRWKFSKFKGGSVALSKDENAGVARIRIDNPSKRNSMSGEMMLQLYDAVSELKDWNVGKALILHGSGGFFCSGADLEMVKAINTPEQGAEMATIMHAALTGLQELPLISVALIEGRALGGGAEMTTACDFRLVVRGAEVQFVHLRMGLVPGWGGTTRLVRLLGPKMALHLLASGCKLSAERAVDVGFAEEVVTREDPLLQAQQWLKQYTTGNRAEIIQVAKQTIVKASNLPPAESLAEERKLFASVWGGPANREALERNIRH